LFWLGQLAYQKLFRHSGLNTSVSKIILLYRLGRLLLRIVIALGGVFRSSADFWQDKLLNLATYGATVILFMLAGAWVGDYLILRNFGVAIVKSSRA